jgi:serine O-acetyltransferase
MGPMFRVSGVRPAQTVRRLREECREDLASMAELKRVPFPTLGGALDVLMLPGTWAVLLFRLSTFFHRVGLRPLSRAAFFANVVLFGVDLAPTAEVGPGLALPHPVGVAFSDVRLGRRVRLMGGVRLGGGGFADGQRDGFPTIGDEAWVFDGAKIFGPVAVGSRSVVGTNSVVTRSLPEGCIAVGNPARVVGFREGGK